MSTYPQRVADNILPLSLAETLPEAFTEWCFTENIEDHEVAKECCGLCNQEQLRYHFEIKNKHTSQRLWVGSNCILQFHLQVFDNGIVLDQESTAKKLEALKRKMRLDSCIKALKALAASEKSPILSNALDFYIRHKNLTPKYAFVVFWRLKSNGIDHSPSFFKITLKNNKYKNDLATMPSDRVHIFWPALSSSQRKLAISYGHPLPK